MFKITDAEKLRDAYTLLAFIRDDVPTTTAEQKSGLAAFMVSIKKEIRAYNNRRAEVRLGRLYGQHQERDPGLQQPPGT